VYSLPRVPTVGDEDIKKLIKIYPTTTGKPYAAGPKFQEGDEESGKRKHGVQHRYYRKIEKLLNTADSLRNEN
jgi:hypothetical protein